jgi:hypothetical protein
MYKWIWWWNEDESDTFLTYSSATEGYRELHRKINTRASWNISEIIGILQDEYSISREEIPDFRETLEKTIDKMGFSL